MCWERVYDFGIIRIQFWDDFGINVPCLWRTNANVLFFVFVVFRCSFRLLMFMCVGMFILTVVVLTFACL